MKSRRLILSTLLLVLFSSRVESQTVVRQAGLGKNACGPCAVINSLSAINHSSLNQLTGSTGVDKARTFIELFGKEQSIIYGEFRTAYSNEHGASDRDLNVGNLSQDGLGFMVSLSDSLSGKRIDGFIYLDKSRKAVVPMDFSVDENGKEKWNWISGFDALTIVSPEMPLETVRAKWHERTLIVVRYIITK